MARFRFDRLLELLTSVDVLVGLLWLGLACLTIAILVLMQTRWGQSQPLRKCLVLSFLAHLLLAGYATTVSVVASVPLNAKEPVMRVSITEEEIERVFDAPDTTPEPWDSFAHQPVVRPDQPELARAEPPEPHQPLHRPAPDRTGLPDAPSLKPAPLAEPASPEPESLPDDVPTGPTTPSAGAPLPIEAPSAQHRQGARTEMPDRLQLKRRPASADTPRSKPERSIRAGLPSPLLERPLPMPRLAHVQATADPEPSLSGLSDSLTRGSQGKPAEWSVPQRPQAGARADAAPIPGTGPAAADFDRLKPPSIAMRQSTSPLASTGVDPVQGDTATITPQLPPRNRRERPDRPVPAIYRLRLAPDRSSLARLHGATLETEAAVKAALAWLAANQAADGHWSARTHGAGRELFVAGRDRLGAGIHADTGLTGLALLAYLASGHTHQDGQYKDHVRRGLEYLLRSQAHDGNLGGKASTFAFMYCHAMAACALSEAYGMTGDARLREPVYRALRYTIAAQDPSGGGWRYRPGNPGDTSQLGWQLMALKSAELAGIPIPERCRQNALKYLDSASSGQYGGLAAYRPVEHASRPMTAEALVCRLFLGMSPTHATAREAGDYLLQELPGEGRKNLYYWYYGTLGMYYLQGMHWQQWNSALQKTLLANQRKRGPLAGSWDPDSVWGGYGGRVYSTALATLCLEVYYRFLPLYLEASVPGRVRR